MKKTANELLFAQAIEDNIRLTRRNLRLLKRAYAFQKALIMIKEGHHLGQPEKVAEAGLEAGERYPVTDPI